MVSLLDIPPLNITHMCTNNHSYRTAGNAYIPFLGIWGSHDANSILCKTLVPRILEIHEEKSKCQSTAFSKLLRTSEFAHYLIMYTLKQCQSQDATCPRLLCLHHFLSSTTQSTDSKQMHYTGAVIQTVTLCLNKSNSNLQFLAPELTS